MEKKLLLLPGYLVGLGGLALITYRTLLAVGTESKSITVQVNRFGELYVDLVLLGVLWVVCVVGMWSLSSVVREKIGAKEVRMDAERGQRVGKPAVFHDTVPYSFFNESSNALVKGFEVPYAENNVGVLMVNDDETNSGFSFSVQVVSDITDDENRY